MYLSWGSDMPKASLDDPGALLLEADKQKMGYTGWICLQAVWLLFCLHEKVLGQSAVLTLQCSRGSLHGEVS